VTHTAHPKPSQEREAAGRLLEVAGDGHPRQMTISPYGETELGLRLHQRRPSGFRSGGLLVSAGRRLPFGS